jgi:hypothetical protein
MRHETIHTSNALTWKVGRVVLYPPLVGTGAERGSVIRSNFACN